MKNSLYLGLLTLVCVAAVSCRKENLPRGSASSSSIGITVLNVQRTKAEAADEDGRFFNRTFVASLENGDSLVIDGYVAENTSFEFDEGVATKGAVASTSSINTEGNVFLMTAYLGSENRYDGGNPGDVSFCADDVDNYRFIDAADVICSSTGTWALDGEYMWRNDVPTTFWSVWPKSLSAGTRTITWPGQKATDEEQASISFSYEMPCGSSGKTDAADQQDLLFACTRQRWTSGSDARVAVDFCHALAAIRFDVSGAKGSECTVKEISIDGISYTGDCVASFDSSLSFEWTPGTGTAKCAQVYETSDFSSKSLDGVTPSALQSLDNGKIFFFIPQAVKDRDIKIGLRYTRADGNETYSECILSHDESWEAGKIYTYRIGVAADKVDVQLLETLSGDVKSDVYFRNNGNTRIWVRAALVGNWFNDSGAIVGSWSPDDTESGTFEGLPGSDWVRKSDGFFYYTKGIDPQALSPSTASTSKLFTRYTRKSGLDDRHLELMVLVQGVRYDINKTYDTAWQ